MMMPRVALSGDVKQKVLRASPVSTCSCSYGMGTVVPERPTVTSHGGCVRQAVSGVCCTAQRCPDTQRHCCYWQYADRKTRIPCRVGKHVEREIVSVSQDVVAECLAVLPSCTCADAQLTTIDSRLHRFVCDSAPTAPNLQLSHKAQSLRDELWSTSQITDQGLQLE